MEISDNPETQEDDKRRDSDDDEALSLCDLPLIHHQSSQDSEEHTTTPLTPVQAQDDFNFCSLSKESQMSAADEIFCHGQILPLRRCISSTNRFLQYNSISRSESIDPFFSGRSSSINSHHSSSSSGSSTAGATTDPRPPPRNQFHSHPSPSPRILRKNQQIITSNNRNCVKKSWPWNVFRLGLISAQPEIAFDDLRTRCSVKNSGGRSSSSSEKKSAKAWDVVGGCKCSIDAVDDAVPREIAFMKRSASGGERQMNKSLNHRTYEWLRQLSLQGTAAAER